MVPSKENAGITEISKQLIQLEEEWKRKKYI